MAHLLHSHEGELLGDQIGHLAGPRMQLQLSKCLTSWLAECVCSTRGVPNISKMGDHKTHLPWMIIWGPLWLKKTPHWDWEWHREKFAPGRHRLGISQACAWSLTAHWSAGSTSIPYRCFRDPKSWIDPILHPWLQGSIHKYSIYFFQKNVMLEVQGFISTHRPDTPSEINSLIKGVNPKYRYSALDIEIATAAIL